MTHSPGPHHTTDTAHDPTSLPADLPVPVDDGACLHLLGQDLPSLALRTTDPGRGDVHLGTLSRPAVLFFYPRTGIPGKPPGRREDGVEWDRLPGARGCTPQACGFRDLRADFDAHGVDVLGVSTNSSEHQQEFAARAAITFPLLSDASLRLTHAMRLPTFDFPVEPHLTRTLLRRMAWFVEPPSGPGLSEVPRPPRIRHVWYPVFPPDANAHAVLSWVRERSAVRLEKRTAAHDSFVLEELTRHWGSTQIWSRGVCYEADRIEAVIAMRGSTPVGLITFDVLAGGTQLEVVTLSSREPGRGVGLRLLQAAEDIARDRGCWRIFLTTTNDNIRAIRFYQQAGWSMAALHRGIIDHARSRGARIPRLGLHGLPLRDEIEFEREFPLTMPAASAPEHVSTHDSGGNRYP